MSETILSVEKLKKQYKKILAVGGISFEVKKGRVFGILGPNGSGKSTTLGMLLSITHPSSGQFKWFDGGANHKQRKRIGAILEGPHFYEHFSAYKNLVVVAKIKQVGLENIEKVLKKVHLWERKDDKFKTYSLGMKQRLSIASALLNDPEVLILDEPTNGLDPQGIADIRSLILDIAKSGKTIILASHLLDEVEKVCDEYIVLKEGKLIHQGFVDERQVETIQMRLASLDMPALENSIRNYPDFVSLEKGEVLTITFKASLNIEALANYCFDEGHRITHMDMLRESLEHQFLDILEKHD